MGDGNNVGLDVSICGKEYGGKQGKLVKRKLV
jgi:hypothetical protein